VVLFERTDTKDVGPLTFILFHLECNHDSCLNIFCAILQHGLNRRDLERMDYPISRHPEFRYKTEFQSHEPEVASVRCLCVYGLNVVIITLFLCCMIILFCWSV